MNNNQELIIEEIKNLSNYQQQEVINFIQFLQYKTKNQEVKQQESLSKLSAYDIAKDLAGAVDFGPGDLAKGKGQRAKGKGRKLHIQGF